MGACGRLGRERSEARGLAHHTPESLLTGSVPQLEANFDAINIHLLCDEESAAGGSSVLWIELVLGIALKKTSFANAWKAMRNEVGREMILTRVAHNDDLAIDAMVIDWERSEGGICLHHGEGQAAAQKKERRDL